MALALLLPPATAKLKKEHFISCLFNHKNDDKFNELFDSTLWDISNTNLDVFSVSTGSGDKIRLFDEHLSQNVTESNRRSDFCKAMIDKLVTFSFADAFSQKYDFFATIFEYLIKDYNKDFGKYIASKLISSVSNDDRGDIVVALSNILGLEKGTHLGEALHFFIYDTIKIFILLSRLQIPPS